jgi:DNA-binding transcriptional LysR family regulator
MTPLMAPLMYGLAQRHPGLRIHGETAPGARLLPLLDARELDIVIMGNPPTSFIDAYAVELILEAPSVFVADPSHPLAMERDISVARLAEFSCGGSPSPGSSNTRLLEFEGENLSKYTASHYDFLLPLVRSGDAVLLAPIFVVQSYVETGEMVVLDVRRRIDAKFYFVSTRAASLSPVVREVREHARAIGAQLRDDWRDVASQFTAA